MNATAPSLPPFKDFLIELVIDNWTRTGEGLLLARVGQIAAAKGYHFKEELGGLKLVDFIKNELSGFVEVSASNTPPHLWVKPGSELSSEVFTDPTETTVRTAPRLNKALWLAFSRPVAEGKERRIQLEPSVRFWDLTPPLSEVAGRLPIAQGYIATLDVGSQDRDHLILENIRKWMHDNKLDIERYSQSSTQTLRATSTHPLLALIAALDESEQKRVSIPLDIIAKLIKN